MFLLAQFIGIAIMYNYIDFSKSEEVGKTTFQDLPIGERPPEDSGYLFILTAIIVGTLVLLLFIKLKLMLLWRVWFLLATAIGLLVAFSAFIREEIAFFLAAGLAIWKVFKPNFWIHTLTELFIYGGLAAIFVPSLNLFQAVIIMIVIAFYDAYAVWKSKHMITLAKSQTKAKIFAGLLVPYKIKGMFKKNNKEAKAKKEDKKEDKKDKSTKPLIKTSPKNRRTVKVRTAMLGGGDIAFSLIFAGVVLKELGLWQSLIIPFFAAAALGFLFWWGEEKKFYPAMPFISVGCFLGLGFVWLIGLLI